MNELHAPISDGLVVRVSRRFESVIGTANVTPIGRDFEALLGDESRARFAAPILEGRAFRNFEVRASFGEEPRWRSLTMRPFLDKRGCRLGWRGVGSDVTTARLAHERLTQLATKDLIAGLMNRSAFTETLATISQGDDTKAIRPASN